MRRMLLIALAGASLPGLALAAGYHHEITLTGTGAHGAKVKVRTAEDDQSIRFTFSAKGGCGRRIGFTSTLALSSSNRFRSRSGAAGEVKGRLVHETKASGTARFRTVVGGALCDTGTIRWTARQR